MIRASFSSKWLLMFGSFRRVPGHGVAQTLDMPDAARG